MNNKSITLGLAEILLILLFLFFIIQNFLFDKSHQIENILINLEEAVQNSDWSSAESSVSELDKMWEKGKSLVSLNNAEQDYSNMNKAVDNLKGAVKIKDQYKAVEISEQIIGYWKNFRRLIPEP